MLRACEHTKNKMTLGVVMIVRNEEHNLREILSDIRDVVDEICVVDTGSTDGTIALAESFGARIGHVPWMNDFSAARNHCLAMAGSDYLLWLDADDRLGPHETAKLARLRALLPPQKDRAYLLKVNTSQAEGNSLMYQLRIFPNLEHLRFEGRIHEQIAPSIERAGIHMERVDILIEHTGYHKERERTAKLRRNLEILLEEREKGARLSSSEYFFMALSSYGLGDYEHCLEYIGCARAMDGPQPWLQQSFSLTSGSYINLSRIDEAVRELEQGVQAFPDSGVLYYLLGAAALRAEKHAAAVDALQKATRLGIGVETFAPPPGIHELLPYYLGMALEKSGREQDAIAAYKDSLTVNPQGLSVILALSRILSALGRSEEMLPYLEKAREHAGSYNHALWLSLAKMYTFLDRPREAHALYREIWRRRPKDLEVLSAIITSSVFVNDPDSLAAALETIMDMLGMDSSRELDSVSEVALLCAKVGRKLYEQDGQNIPHVNRLGEAALLMDPGCIDAHFLLSDVLVCLDKKTEAVQHLEQALRAGAPPDQVESRLARL